MSRNKSAQAAGRGPAPWEELADFSVSGERQAKPPVPPIQVLCLQMRLEHIFFTASEQAVFEEFPESPHKAGAAQHATRNSHTFRRAKCAFKFLRQRLRCAGELLRGVEGR
jgi:hypothetical protein